MENHIVKKAEDYVTGLLEKGLTKDHLYHNLQHTLSARDASLEIGKRYQLSDDELELLAIAALFHDTGFTKAYNGHEDVSKEIATEFLRKENYPEEKIRQVTDLIEITKLGVEPQTLLQKILKDADFNTMGGEYLDKSKALRHEWRVFNGMELKESEWLENTAQFWESHRFYTGEGLSMYGEEKRRTQKKLKKEMEKKADGKKKKEVERELDFTINESKSAQMMFKTTLRNHVDLTNIADNKANIMLSINSLLITIAIPMLAGYLEKFPNLIFPAAALLITCILSIVFATLATRPVKMHGFTNLDNIREGKTNLFFFGNFYKMDMEEYRKGLLQVVKDESILDNTIVTDLFFLGRTLGVKFQRLRICYSIFMTGMITTVLTFAVTLILSNLV